MRNCTVSDGLFCALLHERLFMKFSFCAILYPSLDTCRQFRNSRIINTLYIFTHEITQRCKQCLSQRLIFHLNIFFFVSRHFKIQSKARKFVLLLLQAPKNFMIRAQLHLRKLWTRTQNSMSIVIHLTPNEIVLN